MSGSGYIENEWPHRHVSGLTCQTVPMQEEGLFRSFLFCYASVSEINK